MNKTRFATSILALASAPLWAGKITDTTNAANPLYATSATSPETLAQLANTEVIFNFGSFKTTANFNATGQAADSANDGIVSLGGPDTDGFWDVQNNSGGPGLLSVTLIGAVAGGASGTAFSTSLKATCSDPSLCPVNATAAYSSPIGLNGAAPKNNIYGTLILTFASALADQSSFDFKMDSDYLTGPITNSAAAPEPGTVAMATAGLLCIGGVLRRRMKHGG